MGSKALIVVDMQNDFMEGSGVLPVLGSNELIPIINEHIDSFKRDGDLVCGTMDYHPSGHISFVDQGGIWPQHCMQDTDGVEIVDGLHKFDYIIHKGTDISADSYSGFKDDNGAKTNLEEILNENGITELYVCGVATDYCVKATVLDAIALKYDVRVCLDACAGVSAESTNVAIAEMMGCGVSLTQTRNKMK